MRHKRRGCKTLRKRRLRHGGCNDRSACLVAATRSAAVDTTNVLYMHEMARNILDFASDLFADAVHISRALRAHTLIVCKLVQNFINGQFRKVDLTLASGSLCARV